MARLLVMAWLTLTMVGILSGPAFGIPVTVYQPSSGSPSGSSGPTGAKPGALPVTGLWSGVLLAAGVLLISTGVLLVKVNDPRFTIGR